MLFYQGSKAVVVIAVLMLFSDHDVIMRRATAMYIWAARKS